MENGNRRSLQQERMKEQGPSKNTKGRFGGGAICYFGIIGAIHFLLSWLLSFVWLGFVADGFYFVFFTIPLMLYGRKKGIRTGALSGFFIANIPFVSLFIPSPLLFFMRVQKINAK